MLRTDRAEHGLRARRVGAARAQLVPRARTGRLLRRTRRPRPRRGRGLRPRSPAQPARDQQTNGQEITRHAARRAATDRGLARPAPDDAARPPIRGALRRDVRAPEDRRLLPPRHRPGGLVGRRHLGARARRLHLLLVPRARARAGQGRRPGPPDGRTVRPRGRRVARQGRLDAPVRRDPGADGRPRDRRRPPAARPRHGVRHEVPRPHSASRCASSARPR